MDHLSLNMAPMAEAITAMDSIAHLRLFQLISPSLPTGAFSYSQGLEWAVEQGWVQGRKSLKGWLEDVLATSLGRVDVPLIQHMYAAVQQDDSQTLEHLIDLLLACRETSEMQQEEKNRGRAMTTLLVNMGLIQDDRLRKIVVRSQLAGYSLAACRWKIPLEEAVMGYLWSWLENQVLAGVKIIPLGQTDGQLLLTEITDLLPQTIEEGFQVRLEEVGASSPALALASSLHETQYCRIYRS